MKEYSYKTHGTCSRQIDIVIDGDYIKSIKFVGGCPGNTQGVAKLCEGRQIDEIISLLDGTKCGPKSTSCPDQLAKALKEIKNSID